MKSTPLATVTKPSAPQTNLPESKTNQETSAVVQPPQTPFQPTNNPSSSSSVHSAHLETKAAQEKPVTDNVGDFKKETEAQTTIMLTRSQVDFLNALQSSGIESTTLQQLTQNPNLIQELQTWSKRFNDKLAQFELQMTDTNQTLNPEAQREQLYIDKSPKLKNYQRRLEKELNAFLMCYFLAPVGLFKLEDNNTDTAISAIGNIPFAGQFLKVLTSGLSYANKKYRHYQINRINELFNTFEHISQTCRTFSRHLTLSKEDYIEKLVETQYEGLDKIKGFYQLVKETLEQKWEGLATSDKTGICLVPEDKLAMLDCAYLLQQILSGEVNLDKTKDLAPQFIKIITGQTYNPKSLSLSDSPKPNSVAMSMGAVLVSSTLSPSNVATLSEVDELRRQLAAQQEAMKRQQEEIDRKQKAQEEADRKHAEELKALREATEASNEVSRALAEKVARVEKQIPKPKPAKEVGGSSVVAFVDPEEEANSGQLSSVTYEEFSALKEQMSRVTHTVQVSVEKLDVVSQNVDSLQHQSKGNKAAAKKSKPVVLYKDALDEKEKQKVGAAVQSTKKKQATTLADLR